MKNFLLSPDVFSISLLSGLLLILSYFLSQKKIAAQTILMSAIGSLLVTFATAFVAIERSCGSEKCWSQGWPHFLFLSTAMDFNMIKMVSQPLYVLTNIVFYFSVIVLALILFEKFSSKHK